MKSQRTGLSALLEYASSYGLKLDDGVQPAELALLTPKLIRQNDEMFFEFSKRLDDPRLEYIVECSSNMTEWHHRPECFAAVPLSAAQDNAGRVRYRVLESENSAMPFIRVRVTLKD